jgi:antirestriction protein ArdC
VGPASGAARASAREGDRDDDTGPDTEQANRRFVARYYTVFNVEQCEGIDYPSSEPVSRDIRPLERC